MLYCPPSADQQHKILVAELAELSTNPALVRASNPRLKPQTVSGSIAQVRLQLPVYQAVSHTSKFLLNPMSRPYAPMPNPACQNYLTRFQLVFLFP